MSSHKASTSSSTMISYNNEMPIDIGFWKHLSVVRMPRYTVKDDYKHRSIRVESAKGPSTNTKKRLMSKMSFSLGDISFEEARSKGTFRFTAKTQRGRTGNRCRHTETLSTTVVTHPFPLDTSLIYNNN
ncbi:hypothetical protein MTR_3g052140 [Medicago truncatula]|uniref:Uncharacterized protein n=1 Tax=Medicago truncatula TaxID=3880 RepID=G7IY14_MEDTR|nr:hypothetical protein MTR_3g052140 [Medicago truncatula]